MLKSLIFSFICTFLFLPQFGSAGVLANLEMKTLCAIHSKKCPDAAKSLPEPLKMALFSCQTVAQSETCKQVVKKEPEFYGRTKRCELDSFCSDHLTQEIDSLKSCGQGFLEGTGEIISDLVELFEKENQAIAICDQSLQCKRDMVEGNPKFKDMPDATLSKYSAAALKVERNNFIYIQSSMARQSVKGKTLSERAEEMERRQSLPRAKSSSGIPGKSVIAGVKEWLEKKGARLECLDTKTQAEMICWGAAYILDPTILAPGVLKGAKMARVVANLAKEPLPAAMMGSASRSALKPAASEKDLKLVRQAQAKDAEIIRKMRTPAVDGATLKRHVNEVWSDASLPVESKISDTFDEYIRLRSSELSSDKKRKAQEALENIKIIKEKNAGYYPVENEIRIGDALTDDALTYYQTVVHEFEHVTQNPALYAQKKPTIDRMKEAYTKFVKKKTEEPAKLGENKNYPMEFEAIGAQWDFLQAIPQEVREQSIRNIKASTAMSLENKTALIKDLENASLSREDFLKTVPKYHNYSNLNDVKFQDDVSSVMRNAAILGTAMGALGAADYIYDKNKK